jgi:hypothetical protein
MIFEGSVTFTLPITQNTNLSSELVREKTPDCLTFLGKETKIGSSKVLP